jgi:VanZ family protein
MAVIFTLSANPKPYSNLPTTWSESLSATTNGLTRNEVLGRFLHVGEYIILAVVICYAIIWRNEPKALTLVYVIGFTCVYALSDEFHQHFVPGRAFQWSDLLLDLTGIMIGVLSFLIIKRINKKRS